MEEVMQKMAMRCLSSFRSLIVLILKTLGGNKRIVFDALVYDVIRPIWNLLPNMSGFSIVASVDGNRIRFRPFVMHDLLFVLASRNHEPLVQRIFQPRPGEVVIDVGAHIGLYTLKAARAVGAKGKVLAVEPDPQSYLILQENIASNHLDNVTTVNAALCDTSGKKPFYACTDPSLSGFELQSEARLREVKFVQALTIDELLRNYRLTDVSWIKVDVEGAELNVLQGGKHLLKNAKRLKLVIESSNNQVVGYLEKFGYKTVHLGEIYYFASK